MKPRRLTVSRTHPESRGRRPSPRTSIAPMPLLRLQGRWLAQAGFSIGSSVRVAVAPGLIALEVIDENDKD